QAVDLHDVDATRFVALGACWRGRDQQYQNCQEAKPESAHALSYHARDGGSRFLLTSHVVIVAGKGGVGKTTVTAALAVAAARAGLSSLIVEVEGKSGLPAMFDAAPFGYDEVDLEERIRARFLTPDAALVDYLVTHGMKRISKRLVASG